MQIFFRNSKFKTQAEQVIWITIAWLIVGCLDALNTYAVIESDLVLGTYTYEWRNYLLVKLGTALASGLLFGGMLIFSLRERVRRKTFGFALLTNSVIISMLNFGMIALTYHFFLKIDYSNTAFFLKSIVLWTIVTVFTIIFLHVNDKFGHGTLLKLLLGRYHKPREEERIFMFADIKSSTTIAEQLGHIRFFNLLNDFFRDITNSIIFTKGEIYQYVGDQIVISWSMQNGLKNGNCVKCFYKMRESILQRSHHYMEKYNLVPEFKVGLHCGSVTTGEIGVIKRDIVFSGDVLNTTARIESLCNLYSVKILFSKYLLDKLNLPPNDYVPERMGVIELKGKKQRIELYTFENTKEYATNQDTISST